MSAPCIAGLALGSHRFRHDCKESSTSKPLHVDVTAEGAVWTCFRCGESGALRSGRARPATPNTVHETLSQHGRDLWASCKPIAGIALDYLRARHCVIPPSDSDLRYHHRLRHPSGYEGAALVALVSDALSNEPRTLHRTWIRSDGTKADVDPPRLLLKGHRKAGGAIRLWPDECITTGLGVAEGIETALCAAHAFTPMWAAMDAGNLAAFPVLRGIESLTIFADHDEAGLDGARRCAERWAPSAEVTVIKPKQSGADFADVVSA